MQVALSEAKAQLADLVRRAEAGDEVILTRRGEPTVRLVPVVTEAIKDRRWRLLEELRGSAKGKPGLEGTTASNITDFLYDDEEPAERS